MTEYKTNYELNGFTILDATDEDDAMVVAREYIEDVYPELAISDIKVNSIGN